MSNIRVAVRVRPLSEKEKQDGSKEIVAVKGNSVTIENVKVLGIPEFGDSRSRYKEFLFDHCYNSMQSESPYTTQGQVFEDLGSSVLKSAHDGFNACVFAYGQTGTGKTHTMMGYQNDPGLIPRICEGLFPHVTNDEGSHISCRVDISYFEIYNEKVRDLLQPFQFQQNPKFSLKVRNHPRDGPYVEGLSWHRVKDNEEIQALINKGNEFRVTAETYIHDRSSRSHAIVTVCFTQARLEQNRPSEIVSKINLVDLAGSERADPSSKPDFRKRLTEGSNINRSLVTLGYIIKALAERSLLSWDTEETGSTQTFSNNGGGESIASNSPSGPSKQRLPFIPYRDSVLTWLLKDSLGGNSKTIMIATITPASQYYSETLSTLRYAQRAKNIVNKPRINEDGNVALIRELRREIGRLHEMLADAKKGGNLLSLPDSEDAIIAEKLHENEEMAKQLTESWMCKWSSTHDIMKESDLSIRGLRNRSSSMGVMIDSQLPYLIGMDDDKLSTGVVIFHLKEGETFVGRESADRAQDIVLIGPNILTEHCTIRNVNGEVTLVPNPGSMCLVQGQECIEPTKLSQGDYVVLGGDQVFRFNNPTEAAKLREHRRSQGSLNTLNTSHLSFGGLSRASSYSSIGGDDHSSISPYSQCGRSYPNYAAPDLCLELEKRHQSEKERIDLARQELDQLRQEHERAEELRQEKEEEMYMLHEQHKQDLEDQKQHLARLIAENERAREKAEEELSHARESLAKEKEAFQKELDAERKRLKQLKNSEKQQKLKSSGFQTDSPCTATTSTGADAETQPDEDGCPSKAKLQRRMSVEEQLRELEQNEFTRRMSYRETEQSLSIQEEDIEDQYLQTQDQIQAKIRQIRQVEEEYKELDKTHLLEINTQAEKLKELHKKEAQLEVYIQEKEELINVGTETPTHLRNASSELYLAGQTLELPNYCEQKTSSLQDIQTCLKEEADQGLYSPRSLNRSASAESIESGAGDIGESSKAVKTMDDKTLNRSKKDFNITGTARDVTSRLYKPPEPKFKYVPKTHEKEVKPVARTRVTRDRNVDQHARGSPSRSVRDMNKGNSPSPSRFIRDSSKSHSPSPKRQIQKKPCSSTGRDTGLMGNRLNKSDHKTKQKPDDEKKTKIGTKVDPVNMDPKQCKNIPGRNQSPTSTGTGGKSPDISPTISPVSGKLGASGKLRQMASASSLASVPESLCEGNDDIGQGLDQSKTPPVIKKRNRRGRANWDDDEFRTHSAPDSQTMASALDKYTEEMDALQSSERIVRDSVIPSFNTSVSVDESQLVSPRLSREIDDPMCEMEIQSGDEMTSDTKSDKNCDNEMNMTDEDIVILSGNLRKNSEGLQTSESNIVRCDDLEEDIHSYNDNDMVDNRTALGKREHKHDSGENLQDPDKDVLPLKKAKPSNKIDFKSEGILDKNYSCSEDSLDLSDDSLEHGSRVKRNKQLTQRLPSYLLESNKHSSEDSFNDSLENQSNDERDTNHDSEISYIQRNDVETDASGDVIQVVEGSIPCNIKGDAVTKDVLDNDKTVNVDPLETSAEKQNQSVVTKTGKLAFSTVVCHDNIDLIEKEKEVPSGPSGTEQQLDKQEIEFQNQGLDMEVSVDEAENKCVDQNINSHSTQPDQDVSLSSPQPDQNINLSSTQPDQTINLSSTHPDQNRNLSSTQSDQNRNLSSRPPDQNRNLGSSQPDQNVNLSSLKPDQNISLTSTQPEQNINLSSTQPDQNRNLSLTQPDQNLNLNSTQPDQNLNPSSIQPDQNRNLSSTQPDQNRNLSSTQPDQNRHFSSTQPDQNINLSSTQPDQNRNSRSSPPDQNGKDTPLLPQDGVDKPLFPNEVVDMTLAAHDGLGANQAVSIIFEEKEPMETNSSNLKSDKTVNDPKDNLVKNQDSSDIKQCTVKTFEENDKPNEIFNTSINSSLNFAEEQQLKSLDITHPEHVQTDFITIPISIQPSIVTEEKFTVDTVMPEVKHYVEEVIAGAHQQCIQNDSEMISETECDDVEINCLNDDLALETICDIDKPFTEGYTPLKENQNGQKEGMLPTDRTQGEDSKHCITTDKVTKEEAKDSKFTFDKSLAPSQFIDKARHDSEPNVVSKMNLDVNSSLNQENSILPHSAQQKGNENTETSDDAVKGVSEDRDDLQSKRVSLSVEEPKSDDENISVPTNAASDSLHPNSDFSEENQSKPAITTLSVEEPKSDDENISVPTHAASDSLHPNSDFSEENQSKPAITTLSVVAGKSDDENILVPTNTTSDSLHPKSDLSGDGANQKPAITTLSVVEGKSDDENILVPTNTASDSLHRHSDLSEDGANKKPSITTSSVVEGKSDDEDILVPTNATSDSLHPKSDLSGGGANQKPAVTTLYVVAGKSDDEDILVPTNATSDSVHPNSDLSGDGANQKPAITTLSVEEPKSDDENILVPTNTTSDSLHHHSDISEDGANKKPAITTLSVVTGKSDDENILVPTNTASDSLHRHSDLSEDGANKKPSITTLSVVEGKSDDENILVPTNTASDSLHPSSDLSEDGANKKPAITTLSVVEGKSDDENILVPTNTASDSLHRHSELSEDGANKKPSITTSSVVEGKSDDENISVPTNTASDSLHCHSDLSEDGANKKPSITTLSVVEGKSDDENISVPTNAASDSLHPNSDLNEESQSKPAITTSSVVECKSDDENILVPTNTVSDSLHRHSDISEESQSKPAITTLSVEERKSDDKDILVPTNATSGSLHRHSDLSEDGANKKPAITTLSVVECKSDDENISVPTNTASDSLHPSSDLNEENPSKPAIPTLSVVECKSDDENILVPTNTVSDSLHRHSDISEESQSKPAIPTSSVVECKSDDENILVPTNTACGSLHRHSDLSEDGANKKPAITTLSVVECKSDDENISVPTNTASDSLHPCSDLSEDGANQSKPAIPNLSVEGSKTNERQVRHPSNTACSSLDYSHRPIEDIDLDDKQTNPAVYTDPNNNLTMEQSCELQLTKELEQTWESEEESRTRTIGICTSPGLLESLKEDEDSNDSLIDPDDELQVLQEALDQLPERPAPPGPQLSTARRAARQRAMIRQKLRAGDSDGVGQLSDEPDNPNKSSSRPDSGSRRRKRPTTTRNSRVNTEHTSDDYDSSENDSTYSEDSADNIGSSVGQNGIISHTYGSSVDVEGLIRAEVDIDCVQNQRGEDMLSRHLRKRHERNSLRQAQHGEESAERESEDGCSRSVGVQTFDRHPRGFSSSSVRTDLSDSENSFASGEFGAMVISPISVWNSNNREDSPCDRNSSSSSGIIKTLSDSEKSLLQTQRSSSRSTASFVSQVSNLDRGPTEVWSSSISDLQHHVPCFEEDLLYVMETEMMSPGASSIEYQHESQSQQPFVMPASHDDEHHVDRPDCSTPRSGRNVDISFPESQIHQVNNLDPNTPVTFEVTIHENNTNVLYNVDKTEYRTYPGRSQDVNREPGIIPDSIHVNIRENVTSRTQESYESHTTESVHLRNDNSAVSDGNDIVLERSYRSSYSSECDMDIGTGETKPKQVTSRHEEVDESRSYILPEQIRDQNSEKRKNVQLQSSGLLGTTNYTDFEKPPAGEDQSKSLEDKLDESECTSDYGTITSIDGRRGFLSFSSDSEDGSPRSSPRLSLMQGTCTSDLGLSFAALDEESLHAHHQDTQSLPAQGQDVCSVENTEFPAIAIASTTAMSLPALSRTQLYKVRHGHVDEDDYFEQAEEILQDLRPSEVSSDEETRDNKYARRNEDDLDTETCSVSTVRPNDIMTSQETLAEGEVEVRGSVEKLHVQQSLENGDFAPGEDNMPTRTDPINCSQQQNDQTPSYSSADDSFLSLEHSETSSCSSDYRTPQQSPIRFLDTEEASSQVEEVFIPDTVSQDIALATTPRLDNMDSIRTSQPVNTSSPKRPANVRTVSVNTDSSSTIATPVASTVYKLPSMFKADNDPGQIEAKRKEIKTKIIKLEYQHRSLSDSAISSDFTDGDSVSLSPRGSIQYEFDKSIPGEKRTRFHDGRDTIRHSPMKVNRAINFDGPVVKRVPFNDSGNVYDQEHEDGERSHCDGKKSNNLLKTLSCTKAEPFEQTKRQLPVSQIEKFPESIIDASLALKPFPIKRSSSLDSIATLVNTGTSLSRAVREPSGPENVDGSIEQEEKHVSIAANGTDDSFQSDGRSLSPGEVIVDCTVDDMDKKDSPNKIQAKSTSFSHIQENRNMEYRRSLSEGDVENLDDSLNGSADSNDSITFVFVGKEFNNGEEAYVPATYDDTEYNPCGSGRDPDSETQSMDSINEEKVNTELDSVNISGRGHPTPDSSVNYEPLLSRSASGDSVIRHLAGDNNEDDNCDQWSSHSASEEIEEIIVKGNHLQNFVEPRKISDQESREMSANGSTESSITTTDNVNDYKAHIIYGGETSPLRHRFGIDEKVLPISERSVSADNIPRQLSGYKDIQRSRSTGMLDVGVVEEQESESGIFPPAHVAYDEDQTDPSFSLRTMSENGLDQISQRTVSEIGASLSNRSSSGIDTSTSNSMSSARVRSVCSAASSSAESLYEEIVINYSNSKDNKRKRFKQGPDSTSSEGEIVIQSPEDREAHIQHVLDTVKRFIFPKPTLIDRGVSSQVTDEPTLVSIGIQTSVEDVRDSVEVSNSSINRQHNTLPALAAPFRAQSMESFGLGTGAEQLQLSDGSISWVKMSELMVETTHLLRSINDRLPEMDRNSSISTTDESQAILKQWEEISIQTGQSLTNLHTVGLQTDELAESATDSRYLKGAQGSEPVEKSNEFTQVDIKFRMEPLDISNITLTELSSEVIQIISRDVSIQTDIDPDLITESSKVDNTYQERTAPDREMILCNSNRDSFTSNPNTESKNEDDGNIPFAKSEGTKGERKPKSNMAASDIDSCEKESMLVDKVTDRQQHLTEKPDGKFVSQTKSDLGFIGTKVQGDKGLVHNGNKMKSGDGVKEQPLLPGFTLPNTKEIDDLRKEHAKLMDNLRKASEMRQSRRDKIQSRKQVSNELETETKDLNSNVNNVYVHEQIEVREVGPGKFLNDDGSDAVLPVTLGDVDENRDIAISDDSLGDLPNENTLASNIESRDIENSEISAEKFVCETGDEMVLPETKENCFDRDQKLENLSKRDKLFTDNDEKIDQENVHIEITETGRGVFIQETQWIVGPCSYVPNNESISKKIGEGPGAAKPESDIDTRKTKGENRLENSSVDKATDIIEESRVGQGIFIDELGNKVELPVDSTDANPVSNFVESTEPDLSSKDKQENVNIEITETGQGVFVQETDKWIVGPCSYIPAEENNEVSKVKPPERVDKEKSEESSDSQDLVKINIQVDPTTGLKVGKQSSKPVVTNDDKAEKRDHAKQHKHTWKLQGDELMAISDEKPISTSSYERMRSKSDASLSSVDTNASSEVAIAMAGKGNNPDLLSGRPGAFNPVMTDDDMVDDVLGDDIVSPQKTKKSDKSDSREERNLNITQEEDAIIMMNYSRSETIPKRHLSSTPTSLGPEEQAESIEHGNYNNFMKCETSPKLRFYSHKSASPASIEETANEDAHSDTSLETVNESFTEIIETKPKRLPVLKNVSPLSLFDRGINSNTDARNKPESPEMFENIISPEKSAMFTDEIDAKSDSSLETVNESFTEIIETKPKRLPNFKDLSPSISFNNKDNSLRQDVSRTTAKTYKDGSCLPMNFHDVQTGSGMKHTAPLFGKSDDATQVSMEFSDDFTQTDNDNETPVIQPELMSQTKVLPTQATNKPIDKKHTAESQQSRSGTSEKLKEDLEKLQQERLHILDLLGLSYLPTSLTVELLEAKLNYCIGQTDLLLNNVEDEVSTSDTTRPYTREQQRVVDYISIYRSDLKKSKQDIKECREKLNSSKKPGFGRGRTSVRKRDVFNNQRQAFIDAFKLERMREQNDYDSSRHGTPIRGNTPLKGNTPLRGNTPLIGNSPVVTPRSERSRSSSPTYTTGYMTPREHKEHLVDLRRQLIRDITEEEYRHRSASPLSMSHTSPPSHQRFTSLPQSHVGFTPNVSTYPDHSPTKYNAYTPGIHDVLGVPRSTSLDGIRPHSHHSSISPPRRYDTSYGRHLSPPSHFDTRMAAVTIYPPQDSTQIMREIEEIKQRSSMSAPLEEMLRRSSFSSSGSHRSNSSQTEAGISPRPQSDPRPRLSRPRHTSPDRARYETPLSLNLDSLQDDTQGPYSPYSAYAREHIIPNERSYGGVLRGSYQLYESPHDRSDTSSNLSYGSDTHSDAGHYQGLDEETVKRLRPVKSSDIKARIGRHKR